MSNILILSQTEKAYNLQQGNVYVLETSKTSKLNKIILIKVLNILGLTPLKINKINSFVKSKARGKFSNKLEQKRNDKFLVTLPAGQIIDEEKLKNINEQLNK